MINTTTPSSAEVEDFYDDFSVRKTVQYRLNGNRRIARAVSRILPYVRPQTRALDIGCGGGIVTEKIAKKARAGTVWGIDISEKAISYARQTVRCSNIEFAHIDIVSQTHKLEQKLEGTVDLVALVDVIEHIPPDVLPTLFNKIDQLTESNGYVICTFPSPEYQRQLATEAPDNLQIIDESISLERLQDVIAGTRLKITHFSYEHVWQENQYIHCVLSKRVNCANRATPLETQRFPVKARLEHALERAQRMGRRLVRPLLEKRYLPDDFQ